MPSTPVLLPFLLFSASISVAQGTAKNFPLEAEAAAVPVPKSYFAINLAGAAWKDSWPTLGNKEVRDFDAAWYHLEPQKGAWDFTHLDADVQRAQQHHADLDLVLESPPTWASARPSESNPYPWQPAGSRAEARDLDDWTNYVRTVAARYRGRVLTYELWNEPNQKDSYSGTVAGQVTMAQAAYRALKAVDPRITVISPSPAPSGGQEYLRAFITAGGGSAFDVLGFHFYDNLSDPQIHPEGILNSARQLHAMLAANGLGAKPVWNTESGYYIQSDPAARAQIKNYPHGIHALDQDEAAAAVARSYLAGWAAGIGRFYWYAWAEPQYALVDDAGAHEKPATAAYRVVERWMEGTTYQSLDRSGTNLWTLTLESPAHKVEHVLWTSAGTQTFTPPAGWRAGKLEDLTGGVQTLGAAPVTVGPEPVLLR